MTLNTHPDVALVFEKYPEGIRAKMAHLRHLIIETAQKIEGLEVLEETLKWGEPSYLSKKGSTIRIDWKAKTPKQYAMYFTCSSQLIPTFKLLYPDVFQFEGKRALIFPLDAPLPEMPLEKCIRAALEYHRVKSLPFLGID